MRCCISCGTNECPEETSTMQLPNPYTLEETIEKLRHSLTAVSNEDALTLLERSSLRHVMTGVMPSSLKRPCCKAPPSRYASVSAALETT